MKKTGVRKIQMYFVIVCLLGASQLGFASDIKKADSLNRNKLNWVIGTGAIAYTGSLIGLGTIWYQDLGRFHLFNDNDGWRYMDKVGHLTTSQHIGRGGTEALRWAGVPEKQAIWYGGTMGFVYLTSVEVFDGFSPDWGFSIGDMVANAAGSALYIGQELQWGEQRIVMKWSYSASPYAKYRPELLGSGSERWLKDYNGQTYWASVNLSAFLPERRLPPWLNIALGYGIDGFTGANQNPIINSKGGIIPPTNRYSQFYISPDLDLSKIRTGSKFVDKILTALNFIKVPLPTLEYHQENQFKFHWLFF